MMSNSTTSPTAAATAAATGGSSSTSSSSSHWLDCSRLLEHAANAEAMYTATYGNTVTTTTTRMPEPETMNFGHPDPPALHMFGLNYNNSSNNSHSLSRTGGSADDSDDAVVLVVAYTKHTVTAQILVSANTFTNNNKNSPTTSTAAAAASSSPAAVLANAHAARDSTYPMDVCNLHDAGASSSSSSRPDNADGCGDNGDEQITCLTVVSLEQDAPSAYSGSAATPTPCVRIAVLLGTNHSRVLTVELLVNVAQRTMTGSASAGGGEGDHDGDSLDHDALPQVSITGTLFEVLPADDVHTVELIRKKFAPALQPFHPTGGVTALFCSLIPPRPLTLPRRQQQRHHQLESSYSPPTTTTHVWITYRDGTIVRLHHAGCFPSIWRLGAAHGSSSLDDMLNVRAVQRLHVRLPSTTTMAERELLHVVPLPVHYPSPAGPLLLTPSAMMHGLPLGTMTGSSTTEEETTSDEDNDEYEHVDAAPTPEFFEALVFGTGTEHFPTFCCYTSENHREALALGGMDQESLNMSMPGDDPSSHSNVLDAVMGGTKALVGALWWGLGGNSNKEDAVQQQQTMTEQQVSVGPEAGSDRRRNHRDKRDHQALHDDNRDEEEPNEEDVLPSTPFPSLWKKPVDLLAGYEFHDAPREVTFCSIDPEGRLAALADTLGRVVLLDLSTKQIIRLWKGFREASCYWIQKTVDDDNNNSNSMDTGSMRVYRKKTKLFLVIHSRQRRVVEVWHVRGPRVSCTQVGRDARIVPCGLGVNPDHAASCYLVHSQVPCTSSLNQMEPILVGNTATSTAAAGSVSGGKDPTSAGPSAVGTLGRKPVGKSLAGVPSAREATLRLQHLQQLLTTTKVQFSRHDVYNALQEIKSLADLCTALDLLAVASVLEERLGVEGSDFQKMAVAYCSVTLDEAVSRVEEDIRNNPSVKLLSRKISYHAQVISAYDVLRKFESTKHDGDVGEQNKNPSQFAQEATGWASTYQQTTGVNIDSEAYAGSQVRMSFSAFASSCVFPTVTTTTSTLAGNEGDRLRIYFSDSSRTRREVLVHIFKPLLSDIFSYGVVGSIFDSLGIKDDCDYILKCIGEWFMTLTGKDICEKGLFLRQPAITRLLHEFVSRELAQESDLEGLVLLKVLYKFCEASTDLVRAFMLATLCREAVKKAAIQREKSSYGKVMSSNFIKDWEQLLRKLRVCLLASCRVKDLRMGVFPVSIDNVNEDDMFSVFEWLARDELLMSHKHEEIVTLEKACAMSSYVFDPSTSAGDGPARFKMLQNSCLTAAISEEERAEYLVDCDDDDSGALLLFLSQYNEPHILVAHRALLLAAEWSKDPQNLEVLRDCLVALHSLRTSPEYISLAVAIRLEVWQSRICPVYRARLFGFDDVQQVSEEVIAPLLQNKVWLIEFGRTALQILNMLTFIPWDEFNMNEFKPKLKAEGNVNTWPPVRNDFMLKRLVEKTRKIDTATLDAHRVVVCAMLMSDDIDALVQCVPAIYECFLPQSLFNPVSTSASVAEVQGAFLRNAVVSWAKTFVGPAMDSFAGLYEIEFLGKVWGFDLQLLRTIFLLAMYELGKDRLVDELLTKSFSQIQVHRFVEDGVSITCRRLNLFLKGKRMRSAEMRDVMGLLDADLCEWIQQRVDSAKPLVDGALLEIPIGSTHLFALRLLNLSASASIDTTIRVKIHSLVVLSGTLLKSLD